MTSKRPECVNEFPLTEYGARKIIHDLAFNHNERIRWSHHVKHRMVERDITSRQVYILLRSQYFVITEGPFKTPSGDWKLSIKGLAAGSVIELTLAIARHHFDPSLTLVTVWVD